MPGITDTQYVNALYDAETRYMDDQLRHVFEALKPIQNETLVVLTADHGEILDEQLGFYDHHGLYEGDIHIPAIFYWPGTLKAGRVPGFIENLDFAPTFFELAGLPDLLGCEGKSLVPCLKGEQSGNYDELFFSEATWQVKRAYRDGKWKFIQSIEQDYHGRPMQELFDLETDPTEQNNIAAAHPEIVAELKAKLDAYVARRLEETGRAVDPAAEQGRCGTRIGTPKDETVGPGATPLHLREGQAAADIPKPEELRSDQETQKESEENTARDENTGTPLHGYVEKND
jgi:arylsulfatase A-like enzyme